MNPKTLTAVAMQVLLMLVGLAAPLAVMTTGETAYLETAPIDPRALFRGDYVTLGYAVGDRILNQPMSGNVRIQYRTWWLHASYRTVGAW